jgi:Chaperone of endosialidase
MATPRVTIDQLPEQAIPEDANYFVIQDSGVSKKMSWATIKTQPSQPLTDHINDTSGAHAASAISAAVAGTGVDAADVQGQLGQLTTLVNGKINQSVADGLYVNITGDAMTGALTLVSDPTGALEAATKQYVDSKVIEAGGGITMAEADDRYVNIDGDTMIGALTVEGGLAVNNMPITSVGPGVAATDAATVAQVTDRVAKAGDAMTGLLTIGNAGSVDQLRLRHASPTLALENAAGSTRYATLLSDATQTRLQAAVGDAHVQSLLGAALLAGKTDMKLSLEDVAGRAIHGWAGFRNPIILPMGTAAGDVEGLLTGKGFRFEIGTDASAGLRVFSGGFEKLSVSNGGVLFSYGGLRAGGATSPLYLVNNGNGPYISFFDGANVDAIGTRKGYMGFSSPISMYVNNEMNGPLVLRAGNAAGEGYITFQTGAVEQGRVGSGGDFMWGKTTPDTATAGQMLSAAGRISATTPDNVAVNFIANIIAGTTGRQLFGFRRSDTTIGTITQNGTTGVLYNQTSHGPFKGNVADLDDDAALTRLETWRPVSYQWKTNADGDLREDGEPSGPEVHGFIAQELYEVQPNAVTPGFGTQAEEDAWRAARNQRLEEGETLEDEDSPFMSWQMDNSALVPDLVAAVQAMARKLIALRTELDELRASVGN